MSVFEFVSHIFARNIVIDTASKEIQINLMEER